MRQHTRQISPYYAEVPFALGNEAFSLSATLIPSFFVASCNSAVISLRSFRTLAVFSLSAIIPPGTSSLTLNTPNVLSVPNKLEPASRGVLLLACGRLARYSAIRVRRPSERVSGSPNVIVGRTGGEEKRGPKICGRKRGWERGSGMILSKLERKMGIMVGRDSASMRIRALRYEGGCRQMNMEPGCGGG